jgi:hypothetical protein
MMPVIPDGRRLELARRALRDFHAQCFWFMRQDAELALEDLPAIARGLRLNGGKQGFLLAAQLCP